MHRLHRLLLLQLNHQLREPPIRLHQTRRRTHKPIRQLPHASKEPILKHPLRLVHEIGQLDRKAVDARLIPCDGCDFRYDDRPAIFRVHVLEVLNAGVAIRAVVVQADIVGRVRGDEMHELLQPFLPILIIRHGGADQFFALVLSQRYHLIMPRLRRALR